MKNNILHFCNTNQNFLLFNKLQNNHYKKCVNKKIDLLLLL